MTFPFGGNQGNNQQCGNPYTNHKIQEISYGSSNYHNQRTIEPDNTGKALDAARANSNWMGMILSFLIVGGLIQGTLTLIELMRSGGGNRSQPMERVR